MNDDGDNLFRFYRPASSSPFHYICVILRQKMEVREKKEMDSFIRVTRRKKEKLRVTQDSIRKIVSL